MNVLKGYKETEIGLLPIDWELKSVGTHCIVKARIGWQGLRSDEYLSSGKYGLITSTDIVDGRVNWGSCCFVSKSRYLQDSNIIVREDDTLVSKDGTIGKVGIVQNIPFPSTLNSGVFVIRPKFDDIYKKYLAFAFKSVYFQDFINRLTAGSTIVHLYQKDIVNFKFPVPPPLEQRAIAEVLSDVDGLIGALDKKIAKKRLIKQGTMQQLLTGKKRLPGFTDDWVDVQIKELGKWSKGQPFSKDKISRDGKYLCIHYGELFSYGEVIEDIKSNTDIRPTVKSSGQDVLFPASDVTPIGLGRCSALNVKNVLLGGDIIILEVTKDYPAYISYIVNLNKQQIIDRVTGTTVKHINSNLLGEIKVNISTDIKEQQAIATILSDMDKEIADLEAQRDKYCLLKSGMMQKLLTGQIRIK